MNQILISILLLSLASFSFSGCRSDTPPKLSIICTLDGFGGGDCADPTGKYVYLAPSQMKNYWATSQTDEANYASWCYGGSPPSAQVANTILEQKRAQIMEAKARFMAQLEKDLSEPHHSF